MSHPAGHPVLPGLHAPRRVVWAVCASTLLAVWALVPIGPAAAEAPPATQPDATAPLPQGSDAFDLPPEIRNVGVVRKPGNTIDLGLNFVDSQSNPVTLANYFQGETPVLLVLGYYRCPQMCDLIINGVIQAAGDLARDDDWVPNRSYRIVMVSIDPNETPALARTKKQTTIDKMRDKHGDEAANDADAGWAFLTGPQASIAALADSVGFQYAYIPRRNEFAHAAAITILTPKGVISNYLAGHRYPTRDVRLALFEASDGKVGNLFDFFLAYCYIYDENEKKYVVFARNVMKIAGGITLVVLTAIILMFFALERRRRQRLLKQPQPA